MQPSRNLVPPRRNSDVKDSAAAGILDWVATIPFLFAFLAVLAVFEVAQRICLLAGMGWHQRSVAALNLTLKSLLRMVGARVAVPDLPDLPPGRPLLIVSNHQSLFDIPILCSLFRAFYPRFVSKIELAGWIPSVSFNLKYGGSAVIDRSNPRQALRELDALAARIKSRNFATVIFPEGTRARDGRLKKFKSAGVTALLERVPSLVVVPVAIDGSWKLARWGCKPVPYGVNIHVAIGEPVLPENEESDGVTGKAERYIADQLMLFRKDG